ncbi:MAG TPA: BamA/TamA family outer membrane protein, partial [Saprospiraceae bacterium]|nr:BamA/TamA family outer membrane protein [Saprospiraceae bacterium]
INNINVYLDVNLTNAQDSIARDTLIDGIHIYSPTSKYIIDPDAIKKMIYFRPGDLYNQDNIDFTNKKLGSLSYFKFIKIRTDLVESEKKKINISLFLTPGKKQAFGLDYEIIYESNTALNQALIGAAINLSYKSKNIFNGGEIMNTELETGIAVNPSQTDRFINTVDIKIGDEIKLPLFSNYLHLWNPLNRIKFGKHPLINPVFYDNMKKLATTSISTSYNFTRIIDLYSINALNLSYGITYQKSNFEKYQFNHLGISFLNTKLDPLFKELIKDNIFLLKSLTERQLFSGILFRDFTYTYYSVPNKWSEDWYGRINFELSGGEVWVVNNTLNLIRKTAVNFSEKLQFSQFARAEFEGRYNKKLTKSVSTAYRALVGIIQPFGYTTQAPFVKQFFVGGPNSLRAWRVRELGPGTYEHNDSINVFYQTGNFKIELNAELRFPLFWRLKGAVFLDVGNVWDLSTSSYGHDGLFTTEFFKQFGWGTGLGLRADFGFFVIRFDAGLKLAKPEKWVFDPSKLQLGDFNPNIAINYPF